MQKIPVLGRFFKGPGIGGEGGEGEVQVDPKDFHIWDAFSKFDTNEDGFIDKDELRELLVVYLDMKEPPTDVQLGRIMARVDLDQDGKISYEEFKNMMKEVGDTDSGKHFTTFNTFDRDGDGYITKEDLAAILKLVHPDMKDSEIDSIMKALDQDCDGKISYKEFISYFN